MKRTSSLPANSGRKYGWLPDVPDQRDFLYSAPFSNLQALPPRTDLRPACPAVYDQEALGSCTANAVAAAVQFDRMRQRIDPFAPSRLFLYYNERMVENTVNSDSGSHLRVGIKCIASHGDCRETKWPYDAGRFMVKPPETCYQDALHYQVVSYQKVLQDLSQMRACLASGFPFIFGFSVYSSFECPDVAKKGELPMPSTGERLLGGHAVMAVGYDDFRQVFMVRNSWGTNWGMDGYFTMPYAYLCQPSLAADFWTLRLA
jgi:C1A family cysteine protease